MTLRSRTTNAAVWQLLARGADRGLRFLASLVLARILAPDDFGLLAATMMVAGIVETLAYLGVDQAVVQSPRAEDPRFLGAAFRVLTKRGALLAVATAVLAPAASWYFEDPAMLAMVLIVAAMPLCAGFENPWMFVERKHLRFRPVSIATITGACAQVVVSVGGAYAGLGAKALALGFVASAAATTAMGWILLPKRLDLTRDREALAELGGFARRAAGVPFLIMLSTSAPSLVLGRIAGLEVLGVFTLAQRLCSLPSEIALPIFGTVLTPAYAGIKDDIERVRRVWIKTLTGVSLLVMPIVSAVVVLDERLPRVLYGDKYAGTPGLVSVIALIGLASSILSCSGAMLWGLGRPEIDRRTLILRIAVIAAVSPVAAWYGGAVAFAASLVLAMVVGLVYCTHLARRIVAARRRDLLRSFLPGSMTGGAVLAVSLVVRDALAARGFGESVEVGAVVSIAGVAMILCGLAIRQGRVG
jgi:lipopolysaccharide exporter